MLRPSDKILAASVKQLRLACMIFEWYKETHTKHQLLVSWFLN